MVGLEEEDFHDVFDDLREEEVEVEEEEVGSGGARLSKCLRASEKVS